MDAGAVGGVGCGAAVDGVFGAGDRSAVVLEALRGRGARGVVGIVGAGGVGTVAVTRFRFFCFFFFDVDALAGGDAGKTGDAGTLELALDVAVVAGGPLDFAVAAGGTAGAGTLELALNVASSSASTIFIEY